MNDSTRIEVIARLVPHIMGERPQQYFNATTNNQSDINLLKSLFFERKEILDKRYTETPDTINQIWRLNNLLYDLKRRMLRRMLMLYRLNFLTGNDSDFDNSYKLTGRIVIDSYVDPEAELGSNTSIIEKPGDNLMRLDFPYMITALTELYNHIPSYVDNYTTVVICPKDAGNLSEPTADEIFGCHYHELEDEKSWSEKEDELRKRNPFIKDPIEELRMAYPYSIQDLLRIRKFRIDINMQLQHNARFKTDTTEIYPGGFTDQLW